MERFVVVQQIIQDVLHVAAMKIGRRVFDSAARAVYRTSPLSCNPSSNLLVLSQSRHADITMYLIAAKSFARFVRPKCFVIIDDGLSDADRLTVQSHLDEVRFIRTVDVESGSCPRHGAWERLISI